MNHVDTVEEYLLKSEVEANKIYTAEEAEKIINENVIALYKGRVTLTDKDGMTGISIAEKLHKIHAHFNKAFDEAWKREFPEDID